MMVFGGLVLFALIGLCVAVRAFFTWLASTDE